MRFFLRFLFSVLLTLLLEVGAGLGLAGVASAQVSFLNGEAWVSVEDMSVKVLGGAETGTTTAAGADEAHERAVANVQVETKTLRAFNLKVTNAHTFFVDKDGVLVHNAKNCWGGETRKYASKRNHYKSKKDTYEAAKRTGKAREPKHHPAGAHGNSEPHYHPNVENSYSSTPHAPNKHDHYYYPRG